MPRITAVDTGILTRDALEGPFGFCHLAVRPRDPVAPDGFYIGA